MKILVIGASGFVGSHIVQTLVEKGINCVALEHKTKVNLNCKTIRGSIEDFPYEEIIKNEFSHIIHAARISGKNIHERFFASLKAQKANQKLLDFIVENTPNTKITYLSGSLVYGDCGDSPVFENQMLNPTAFAREYALAELPFQKALSEKKLQIQICRPAWIIGDGSWFKHFYLDYIIKNKLIPIYSKSNPYMNIIHVNDCSRLTIEITQKGTNGVYNLSSPLQMRLSEFVKELESYFSYTSKSISFWKQLFFETALKEALDASICLKTKQNQVLEFNFHYTNLTAMLNNRTSNKKSD